MSDYQNPRSPESSHREVGHREEHGTLDTFPDPGLPEHKSRMADRDPKAAARQGLQKMKRLVVELLDLARIGRLDLIAAAQTRDFDDIDLNTLVDQVVRQIAAGNSAWSGSIARINPLPVVRGRTTQITEVFQNLVDNAVKYSAGVESPRVEIGYVERPGGSHVFVRDNGCGIPLELQERVFQPLFTTKPVGVGTGLGLSICKELVTQAGGNLRLSSTPGEGTEIEITLRRAPHP